MTVRKKLFDVGEETHLAVSHWLAVDLHSAFNFLHRWLATSGNQSQTHPSDAPPQRTQSKQPLEEVDPHGNSLFRATKPRRVTPSDPPQQSEHCEIMMSKEYQTIGKAEAIDRLRLR
jgi:hypothetical protein